MQQDQLKRQKGQRVDSKEIQKYYKVKAKKPPVYK